MSTLLPILACHSLNDYEHAKNSRFFKGRTAVIANKHKNEQFIGPLLEQHLGLNIIVPEVIDTDKFGTFTRDIERKGTQIEAARAKADEGMRLTGAEIGIASEGSFGPHPILGFVATNVEIVVLVDKKYDLEIMRGIFSLKTNYNQRDIRNVEEAINFATTIGFPSNGIILRAHPDTGLDMEKGVTTVEQLEQAVRA